MSAPATPTSEQTPSREVWLQSLATALDETLFENKTPKYRVTCGWPSRGATAQSKRVIGQCFYTDSSADETHELIISMYLDDPMEVAATLAHEMIHAIVGYDAGHKGPFRQLATEIGLVGKMTATEAGEVFKQSVGPILEKMGPYPHAKLDPNAGRKKQSTRLIKAECHCGYNVRITRKWLDEMGAPHCPAHGEMAVA